MMGSFKSSLLLFMLIILSTCDGAKIMFFFGVSSYSHRIGAWPLTEALAARGHEVTFVSPFPAKTPNPNVTDYVPKVLVEWLEGLNETSAFYDMRVSGSMDLEWYKMSWYGVSMCEVLMKDEADFVPWVKSSGPYDLIVVDSLVNECSYAFAQYYGAKIIVYNTALPFPWQVDAFGFPDESSWVPDYIWHYSPKELNVFKRMVAWLNPLIARAIYEWYYFPSLDQIISSSSLFDNKSHKPLPIAESEKNVSLLFINQHPAEDYPRPFPPSIIPLPGLHCTPKDKLSPIPKDILEFLGNDEFIYLSFGSFAEIQFFPEFIQKAFVDTLNNLKGYKVIWKLSAERPKELKKHIYTGNWMPQQSLLAHPKVRAFVTHGGLLGIQEAIYHSVPLVAFPIFAEQEYNSQKLKAKGIGEFLEITQITEEKFSSTLKSVLQTETYRANMAKVSKRFRDRETPAVETGVWWVEYVLRHEDTSHLKPGSVHLPWWRRKQLDVILLLAAIVLALIGIILVIIKGIIKKLLCGRNSSPKKKNKRE